MTRKKVLLQLVLISALGFYDEHKNSLKYLAQVNEKPM